LSGHGDLTAKTIGLRDTSLERTSNAARDRSGIEAAPKRYREKSPWKISNDARGQPDDRYFRALAR
jgi:hypothetical protein